MNLPSKNPFTDFKANNSIHSLAPELTLLTALLIGGLFFLLSNIPSTPKKNEDLIIEPKFCGSII